MTVRYGTLVRYVTLQFLLRGTVRWYGTPFLEWYGYGTLVRYASKIELKYGTVQGARYVVRKFRTYRTVLPSLVASKKSCRRRSPNPGLYLRKTVSAKARL